MSYVVIVQSFFIFRVQSSEIRNMRQCSKQGVLTYVDGDQWVVQCGNTSVGGDVCRLLRSSLVGDESASALEP